MLPWAAIAIVPGIARPLPPLPCSQLLPSLVPSSSIVFSPCSAAGQRLSWLQGKQGITPCKSLSTNDSPPPPLHPHPSLCASQVRLGGRASLTLTLLPSCRLASCPPVGLGARSATLERSLLAQIPPARPATAPGTAGAGPGVAFDSAERSCGWLVPRFLVCGRGLGGGAPS